MVVHYKTNNPLVSRILFCTGLKALGASQFEWNRYHAAKSAKLLPGNSLKLDVVI